MSAVRVTLLAFLLLAGAGCAKRGDVREAGPDDASKSTIAGVDAYDPWEKYNRKVHGLNRAFDKAVFKPVARTYMRLPRRARDSVGNFFNNLQQPVVALNQILQGEPKQAGQATGRFLLNFTLGIGGLFDPATKANIPYRENDFGQTFALWGWDRSRYFVLPLFGASTVRDGFGRLINSRVSPINKATQEIGWPSTVVYAIHSRASALPNEAFMEGAQDDYILLRDVYFQRRACQIRDCTQDLPQYELPEDEAP